MTHSLTPHEQQQVDAAAKKYANETAWIGDFSEVTRADTIDWEESSFKAGITFALQHLLPGRMEKFSEWIEKNAIQNPDDERFWYVDGEYCDHEELISKYLQHLETLKQKENGK